MSGIVGLFRRDGRSVDRTTVEGMVGTIEHRGPDGCDVVVDGEIGLGNCLFATTPEAECETLPLVDDDLTVVADARIDNRAELLAELESRLGDGPVTDSELVAASYREWGRDCPERLVGAYAFAVWDADLNRLFCARDHAGIRPFYYYLSEDLFAFASEIKALHSLRSIPREVNERRFGRYLASIFPEDDSTYFEDVCRLRPGRWLSIDAESSHTETYWRLDPSKRLDLSSDEAYAEAFRDVFDRAVRCRIRTQDDPASMLSGGIDTSAIVSTADDLLSDGRTLSTYSVVFEDVPAADERRYAQAVVDETSVDPTFIDGTELDPLDSLSETLDHYDQPFLAPNHFLHREMYSRASADGHRVVLDGFDGDRVISHGEGHLADLAVELRPLAFLAELRGLKEHFGGSYRRILLQDVGVPLAPEPLKRIWYALTSADRTQRADDVVDERFADRVGPLEPDGTDETPPEVDPGSHATRIHHARLDTTLLASTLELCDASAAAHGIEPRYPFFDRRLMEFCLSLPPDQKIDAGLTRVVLRRGLADRLPAAVASRGDKANLGPNFDGALRKYGRDRFESAVDSSMLRPFVDRDAVATAGAELFDGSVVDPEKRGDPNGDPAVMVWKAVVAEAWLGPLSEADETPGPTDRPRTRTPRQEAIPHE